jgi:type VII secretion protein EccE
VSQRSIPIPGPGRITLAALAVVPAVLAHPWSTTNAADTTRGYWALGIAAAVVIVLFGWWHGLHFTTLLSRRLAILGRRGRPIAESGSGTSATALLRIGPPTGDHADHVLPLPLIARYLNAYGIRADKIRVTSRDTDVRETWIGLTLSAVDNLAALQARSPRIPLHETAQVAARRLADHLREIGWEAGVVGPDDAPRLLADASGETWRAVRLGSNYLAAYRIAVNDALPSTLDEIRDYPAGETWTALEIAASATHPTVAVVAAFVTDERPAGATPLAGLAPQRGHQRSALQALDLLSTQRLDGHADAPAGLLTRLNWPTPAPGAHRAQAVRT